MWNEKYKTTYLGRMEGLKQVVFPFFPVYTVVLIAIRCSANCSYLVPGRP